MNIYNVYTKEYFVIASFTDHTECKTWLQTYDHKDHNIPAWIGVFQDGVIASAIPMWIPEDFIKDFPFS